MKNKPNADYDMKYWSSLMLFDCARSDYLTQWYVSNAHAAHLHGFSWASKIGSIPASYNALVGYYDFGKNIQKPPTLQMADRGWKATKMWSLQTNGFR